ncbi:MAG: MFS transporter [Hyphomonadaceae bacterium]|nr:MFS transporter [Hyphomonadaceae bacterium]MBC6412204.1 MFS transporter [Hyphomonadaceae bacterium]
MSETEPHTYSSGYRRWALFILIVVYTLNFLDRQIISILAVPIKADLKLTDTQLGLLGGLAFAAFYATLGIPIAWLADRKSRVWIITVALTLWSAMTALCGLAQNYLQLFLARLGVGVGEAGGVAPSYSLLTDYFPPEQRGRAMGAYSLGIPVGSAIGICLGGALSTLVDWRFAFVFVGFLGVAVAPVFRLTMKDPARGQYDPPGARTEPAPFMSVFRTLSRKPGFWLLSFGAASSSMMGYGLFFWLPSFLVRSYGGELPEFMSFLPDILQPDGAGPLLYAAYYYGIIVLIGGIVGIWFGGVLADKYGVNDKGSYARVPAIAFIATIPFFLLGTLSTSLLMSFFVFLVPTALALVWLGPVIAAIQQITPPNMRTTASALFLLINNLTGIALGNYILGQLSDLLAPNFGDESLRYALLSGTVFYLIAAILFLFAARRLPQDWEA